MYTPHEETHHGLTIKIVHDEFPSDCRDWDHGTVMALSHRRYNLPNEAEVDFDRFGGWDEVEADLRERFDIVGILRRAHG